MIKIIDAENTSGPEQREKCIKKCYKDVPPLIIVVESMHS